MSNNVTQINDVQPVYPVTRNEKGQVVHQTPEQLSPYQIAGESEAAKYAQSVFASFSDKLARFNAMWMRRDPKLKDEVRQHSGIEFDNCRADTKAEIKRHEDALKERTGFKVDPALRSLVSEAFERKTPAQRSQAIDALLAEGNGGALAVLYELSPVFTGLAPEQRAIIPDRLWSQAEPQTYAAWNTAKANLDKIERASLTMIAALSQFGNGPDVAAASQEEVHSIATGFGVNA